MSKVIELIKQDPDLDGATIEKVLRSFNKGLSERAISKKNLLPYYLNERRSDSLAFKRWAVDEDTHSRILELLRAKPGRTASGVATVSVLMKPWPCAGNCLYCPNDIRMPKSYLSDEPACQRAEMAWFDPYLQVVRRLTVLQDMGHNIDKVELIVLGGTFDDYSEQYRHWFIHQLFEALDDFSDDTALEGATRRERFYRSIGSSNDPEKLRSTTLELQTSIDDGAIDYNDAISGNPYWSLPEEDILHELACKRSLQDEQKRNESARCKCVGLVIETRPECITRQSLIEKRELGCTKIQVGVQSLSPVILAKNSRTTNVNDIVNAFELMREFGFKSHIHLMQNLPFATLESDAVDFEKLTSDVRFKPDEIKLYPCALVESADMTDLASSGAWQGYNTDDLIELLARFVSLAPRYMRISRMIRDIPSTDIVAGNKITNLRQLVENKVKADGRRSEEIRLREVRSAEVDVEELQLRKTDYQTSNTREMFLEYVDEDDRLAGFLRLSLPNAAEADAMIREVHVYGKVARIGESVESAQHSGLGRSLIEEALAISSKDGRSAVKVISAVGTREYYRNLGFEDDELYQRIEL